MNQLCRQLMNQISLLKRALFLSLFCISFGITGQSSWTGATSDDWNSSSNWLNAVTPMYSDDVIIPSGTLNAPIIMGGIVEVKSVTI